MELAVLQRRREHEVSCRGRAGRAARRSRSMPSSRNALPALQRGRLSCGRQARDVPPTSGRSSESTRRAQRRSRGTAAGRGQPCVAPGPGEGGEHLVRRAVRRCVSVPGPDGVRRAGGHQRRPSRGRGRRGPARRGRRPYGVDSAVMWTPSRRRPRGPPAAATCAGRPVPDHQRAVVRLVQAPQRGEQPGPPRRPGGVPRGGGRGRTAAGPTRPAAASAQRPGRGGRPGAGHASARGWCRARMRGYAT